MVPLLELRNLNLRVGMFALEKISLSLLRGDYLVLLGPSGCGKTTLLRAIVGAHPAPQGALFLEGEDAGSLPVHLRRLGYVAQTVDLFPHMDVASNIRFGLAYLPISKREKELRFERIVALLGVQELLSRRPANLSGGEGKRVALARSLAVGPRALLLDEPLSGIDEYARPEMLRTLKMLHDELGTATIHVTHDRDEARGIGGRCAVMRAGRIEQAGTTEEIFTAPATRFVAEFLGMCRENLSC